MNPDDQEIIFAAAQMPHQSAYAQPPVDQGDDLPVVEDIRNKVVQCGLHLRVPLGPDSRLLWPILLEGAAADADLKPGHPTVLGGTQSLFKYAEIALRTEDLLDSAADMLRALSGEQVNYLVVDLHVQQLLACGMFYRVLEARVENVLALQHAEFL